LLNGVLLATAGLAVRFRLVDNLRRRHVTQNVNCRAFARDGHLHIGSCMCLQVPAAGEDNECDYEKRKPGKCLRSHDLKSSNGVRRPLLQVKDRVQNGTDAYAIVP
jgi:hypothetical protein